MNRNVLIRALNEVDEEYLLQAAPEEFPAGRSKALPRRWAMPPLAACLVLALGISAMAAGLFTMGLRQGEPGEKMGIEFTLRPGVTDTVEWDAKLVMDFDGPEECPEVLFRPAWLPYDTRLLNDDGSDKWFRYFSTENTDLSEGRLDAQSDDYQGVTCQIGVKYACQYKDGALLLSYSDPVKVSEAVWEEWPGWEIHEIHAHRDNPWREDHRGEEYFYIIMFQPEDGIILIVRGQSDMETLEHIARELQIQKTGETVRYSPDSFTTQFIDVGIGKQQRREHPSQEAPAAFQTIWLTVPAGPRPPRPPW